MYIQAKEFQSTTGKWSLLFPDLVGTGKSNTVIQQSLKLSEADLCAMIMEYGGTVCEIPGVLYFYWDETDLKSCRKFKNHLNKQLRTAKVKIKEVKSV